MWEVLCANGPGYWALGVNENVVDDLVDGPLQGRDKLAGVLELMKDQIANRVDGPEDVAVSGNQAQWEEPSNLTLAPTGIVCDAEVLV